MHAPRDVFSASGEAQRSTLPKNQRSTFPKLGNLPFVKNPETMSKTVRTLIGTDDEIQAHIKELETSDKSSENTWKYGCGVALIGGLGLFVPTIMNAHPPSWAKAIAIVAVIAGLIVFAKGRSGDIDDSRYQALERLHRFLSGDCDPKATYRYILDLRPYTHQAFYSHSEKFGGLFSLPKGKVEYFDCTVIDGQVQLRDGTSLKVNVDRLTKRTTRTKRSYSGKTKTKVKSKFTARYSMKAKLPDGPAVVLAPTGPVSGGGRLEIAKLKQKGQGQKIAASSSLKNTFEQLEIEGLLKLLVNTFHQVHHQRQQAT